jgi:nephrocystin-4
VIISDLYIYMNPTVDKFESEFTQLISDDKSLWDKVKMEPSMISIIERRLKIGVHNGWRYVHEPHIVHLSVDDPSSKSNSQYVSSKRHNLKSSLRAKVSESDALPSSTAHRLAMRNSVALDEVFEDSMCAIVFQIEYVVSVPIQLGVDELKNKKSQSDSKKQIETHNILVRWGAYTPFADSLDVDMDESRIEVNLFGAGVETLNPDEKLMFKRPDTNMQDNVSSRAAPGRISFEIRKGNTVNFKQRPKNNDYEFEEAAQQHTEMIPMQNLNNNRTLTLPNNVSVAPNKAAYMQSARS